MLTGGFPFKGIDDKSLFAKIRKGQYSIPDYVSPGAGYLI